jgi:glycosyltransferase involved in cell wall biosynthesis
MNMNKESRHLKRVLIILYYWPPSGGAGVHRWLKFVKYLRNFGWEPIVYVPSNPDYPIIDSNRLDEIPSDIEIIKRPIWEPFSLYRKFTGKKKDSKMDFGHLVNVKTYIQKGWKERLAIWIRGNFFIPDSRLFWVNPSVRFLSDYYNKNKFQAVISSGPPHSLHLIALKLKLKFNVPWMADFRDPWSEYFSALMLTKWAVNKHTTLEKRILQTVDKVVVIGRNMQMQNFENAGVHSDIVMNGFDIDDYQRFEKPLVKKEKFTLLYAGTLSQRRNNSLFWKVIKSLIDANELFASKLNIQLVGKVDSSVSEDIKKYNLESFIDIVDFIPFEEVVKRQMEATVLLLFVDNFEGAKWVLTGKFFEYLASNRPILALGPLGGDLSAEITNTSSGLLADYNDEESMEKAISIFFNQYLDQSIFSFQNKNIEKYSRLGLTQKIASLLDEMI